MKYQATIKCDECGQVKPCLYDSHGPFKGTWRCASCRHEDSEALADIVAAAEKRMRGVSSTSKSN